MGIDFVTTDIEKCHSGLSRKLDSLDNRGQDHFNSGSLASREAGSIILSPCLKTWEPGINLRMAYSEVLIQLSSSRKQKEHLNSWTEKRRRDWLFVPSRTSGLDITTLFFNQLNYSVGYLLWKPSLLMTLQQSRGKSALLLPFIESLFQYSWYLQLTITATTAGSATKTASSAGLWQGTCTGA